MEKKLQNPKIMSKFFTKKILLLSIPIDVIFIIYLAFFNHVEPKEVGIVRNHLTGDTWVQHAGWHITSPWTWVSVVPTHPVRVGVPTSGRGYSAKLVHFLPEHADEFLEREGWRWYWWDNRFSLNLGHEEEYRGFRNILLGYAYTSEHYPFVEILEEYTE